MINTATNIVPSVQNGLPFRLPVDIEDGRVCLQQMLHNWVVRIVWSHDGSLQHRNCEVVRVTVEPGIGLVMHAWDTNNMDRFTIRLNNVNSLTFVSKSI